MIKGLVIDCNFIYRVKDYMSLPRPRRKGVIDEGEFLPIICIEVED